MTDEKTVTLWWISETTAELVEMDVPAHIAAALDGGELDRGEGVIEYADWPQRRFKLEDAEDRLRARLDEIR
jgi:hypothetical protein